MDDGLLLERNVQGLAALYRLVGRHAGTIVEFGGTVGSVVPTAPGYPWLNALVCEPHADIHPVLEQLLGTPELDALSLWSSGPDQTSAAQAAGFSVLIARVPLARAIRPGELHWRSRPGSVPGERQCQRS
ncbi:MAG TPA: hypothetical protein VMU39_24040 [Solirubrobacteraceae bacterium]|nr:hypothetical protein [Solirubrobacteraceae bacterium]